MTRKLSYLESANSFEALIAAEGDALSQITQPDDDGHTVATHKLNPDISLGRLHALIQRINALNPDYYADADFDQPDGPRLVYLRIPDDEWVPSYLRPQAH